MPDAAKSCDLYFNLKKVTQKFIATTLGEREEHGKQAVSSEETTLDQAQIRS